MLFVAMKAVSRHYARHRASSWRPSAAGVDAAGARPRGRAGLEPAGADAAGAGVRARRCSPATLRAVTVAAEEADDPLPREWEERGVPGAAGGDRIALPRDGAPGASLRAPAAARESRGRDLDRDPRVRGGALVAASAAQPDRAAPEGQAAVRALGRGDQRPWVLGHRRTNRADDERSGHLRPQRGPARRVGARSGWRARFGLSRRRQLAGLALARPAAAAADPAARGPRDDLALDGQVLLYLLAVVVVALVGGVVVARRSRRSPRRR